MPFDNQRKTPLLYGLHKHASQKADDAVQILGKALPCHVVKIEGQIVTVAFDVDGPFTLPQVKMPIHTSAYDWLGLQVGDKGAAVPIDVYLGGVSGMGGGKADLTQRANLSTHRFVPITNNTWKPPGNGDQDDRILTTKKGVLLVGAGKDDKLATLYVNDQGQIIIHGDLRVSGAVIAGYGGGDSVTLQNHTHDGVTTGTDDTTKPIAGT